METERERERADLCQRGEREGKNDKRGMMEECESDDAQSSSIIHGQCVLISERKKFWSVPEERKE